MRILKTKSSMFVNKNKIRWPIVSYYVPAAFIDSYIKKCLILILNCVKELLKSEIR